jgi:hypothetical protein
LALRDAQEDLERVRMEREEWEGEAMRERVKREELVARLGQVEMDLGVAKSERAVFREERDREAESAANLHAVLEEFQAGEWSALCERPRDLMRIFLSLCSEGAGANVDTGRSPNSARGIEPVSVNVQAARHKGRSAIRPLSTRLERDADELSSQAMLAAAQNNSEKVLALTKEVKDKSLLIGKLRHEGTLLRRLSLG